MLDMWRGSSAERLSPGGRRGRGGDASRGRGGRAGRGGRGAGVVGRPVASATSATESAMAARIEQLEQRLAAMASSGASTSTSYEEEDFPYLASAAQVEASVAVTRGAARALEPRGATGELDPQRVIRHHMHIVMGDLDYCGTVSYISWWSPTLMRESVRWDFLLV
ncbi:hypothetical protein AXG93_939s1220 [Marchantia polymorpha subsp. ruderalis]|uniref:Uncharacterized protein n=1 Tax=Marchantia polymorpha subsp. ruderalis TaxID=1480154 RepID=A0A176VL09_MARPO|nr:hypothetical protein AXG93_939s1220 [Marchantia polymorpha subsp. ruderalis]